MRSSSFAPCAAWRCAVGPLFVVVTRPRATASQQAGRGAYTEREQSAPSKSQLFSAVFIIAVHRAFVLGFGARHRGIVELSEGVIRCVTVFACYSSSSSSPSK
jgi:hypothetical protein